MHKAINNIAPIGATIALALWVGAMAGFAFLSAPATFHAMGPTPAFAALIASQIEELSFFGHVCAVIVVAACAILAARAQARARWVAVGATTILMAFLVLVQGRWLLPQMRATPIQTAAYAALHHQSSTLYGAVLLLGIIALALAAWRGEPN